MCSEFLSKYSIVPPKYCDFYKKLIVEEVALISYPHNLHYGRCAVIGKIKEDTNNFYLENIRIKSLPKKYQINEGIVSLRLLTNLYQGKLTHGTTVEVLGEAVLYDQISNKNNKLPTNSNDLYVKLIALNPETKEFNADNYWLKILCELKSQYVPSIQVHYINLIDQAQELIETNLEIRTICQQDL